MKMAMMTYLFACCVMGTMQGAMTMAFGKAVRAAMQRRGHATVEGRSEESFRWKAAAPNGIGRRMRLPKAALPVKLLVDVHAPSAELRDSIEEIEAMSAQLEEYTKDPNTADAVKEDIRIVKEKVREVDHRFKKCLNGTAQTKEKCEAATSLIPELQDEIRRLHDTAKSDAVKSREARTKVLGQKKEGVSQFLESTTRQVEKAEASELLQFLRELPR